MNFDLEIDLDFIHDEKFGLSDYYDDLLSKTTNKNLEENPVDDVLNSEFIFKMPNKVENGGRGFFQSLKNSKETSPLTDYMKGTTTLAFVYKDGVIVAVDSRASMGSFMSSKTVKKVIEINDFLLGTMAGGAADCSFWLRKLNMWCIIYELRFGERALVSAAANYLVNMISGYRGQGLSMGTMVTGWDKTGPKLFYVDDDGKCLKGNLFSCGSGSTYAFGVLDSKYKFDMDEETACKVAYEAICHATFRDAGSGGYVRVYSVKENSWRRVVVGDDVDAFHWNLAKSKGLVGDGDETNNEKLKI